MRSGDVTHSRQKRLAQHELIGLHAEVVDATDPNQRGLRGRVVDETYHTLVLEREGREVVIPKGGSAFLFQVEGEDVTVAGDRLRHRPEDRVKKAG